ncbi:MAG: hypothetical protein JNL90_04745 [Planctomycetes bacterium]|nr:hypothetical protein [Planctomycetota bacterium]
MNEAIAAAPRRTFLEELRVQRLDDHRYYHHCRINQSLHLMSACCFLACYALLFSEPVVAALLGWLGAMVLRQSGHFFFEPKGYDHVNQATHQHKEAIKVGYNLRRKIVLLAAWVAIPLVLWLSPSLFGTLAPHADFGGFLGRVAFAWIALGVAALLARTAWLVATRDLLTGAAWATKILTDPFHDVALYWRAPLQLLRGERFDAEFLAARKHGA